KEFHRPRRLNPKNAAGASQRRQASPRYFAAQDGPGAHVGSSMGASHGVVRIGFFRWGNAGRQQHSNIDNLLWAFGGVTCQSSVKFVLRLILADPSHYGKGLDRFEPRTTQTSDESVFRHIMEQINAGGSELPARLLVRWVGELD